MSIPLWAWISISIAVAIVVILFLRRRGFTFPIDDVQLEELLRTAGAATGKPRGLAWLAVRFTGPPLFVRDRGELLALVPVVVQFEPIEGGDLEHNPAAREPRPATAVFAARRGRWVTDGRIIFNHTPAAAAAAFGLRVIDN